MLGQGVAGIAVKSLYWAGDRSWGTSWFKHQVKGAQLVQRPPEDPLTSRGISDGPQELIRRSTIQTREASGELCPLTLVGKGVHMGSKLFQGNQGSLEPKSPSNPYRTGKTFQRFFQLSRHMGWLLLTSPMGPSDTGTQPCKDTARQILEFPAPARPCWVAGTPANQYGLNLSPKASQQKSGLTSAGAG